MSQHQDRLHAAKAAGCVTLGNAGLAVGHHVAGTLAVCIHSLERALCCPLLKGLFTTTHDLATKKAEPQNRLAVFKFWQLRWVSLPD